MSNLSLNAATQPVVATEGNDPAATLSLAADRYDDQRCHEVTDRRGVLPQLSTDDRLALSSHHVEVMTDNVIGVCREVVKVAQDLEALVLQNAARVKAEVAGHIQLIDSVKTQATQLGGMIGELAQTALQHSNRTN